MDKELAVCEEGAVERQRRIIDLLFIWTESEFR